MDIPTIACSRTDLAKQRLHQCANDVASLVRLPKDYAVDYVREKPLAGLGIALFAGLMMGICFVRRA
ncbi:MAG: hypothetical protein ACAI35_12390 [Candidatus Methylacidiphilales bacterium]|nr:hypothetical protein [Candidatus Methylacidiphilales bacterium]